MKSHITKLPLKTDYKTLEGNYCTVCIYREIGLIPMISPISLSAQCIVK